MRWSWMIAAVLLVTSFAATAGGKIYRWTDKNGEVHYSGVAPMGVKATMVKVYDDNSDSGSPAGAQPAATSQPQPAKQETTATGKNGLTAKQEAAIQQNCKYARRNLATFKNPAIRRFLGPDGKVHRYTEKQRQQKIKENQDYIRQFCENASD